MENRGARGVDGLKGEYMETKQEQCVCRISPECRAAVVFNGNITKNAVRKLIQHLELSLDDYPSEAEVELIEQGNNAVVSSAPIAL